MRRKKVRLGLSEKSILEKCELGYTIVTNCTGNTNFPTPSPALDDIAQICDSARTAYEASRGGGVELTAIMHEREIAMEIVLTAFASYVDNIAQGNELIILSAGVDASKDPEHPGNPTQVTGLEAKSTLMQGEIKIRFNKVKIALCYVLYRALTADGPYEQVAIISSTRFNDTDLQSLQKFWYKVQALGRGGKIGPFSDPAIGVAM